MYLSYWSFHFFTFKDYKDALIFLLLSQNVTKLVQNQSCSMEIFVGICFLEKCFWNTAASTIGKKALYEIQASMVECTML